MSAPIGSEAQFGYKFSTRLTSFGEDIWQGPVNKFNRFISLDGMNAQYTFEPVGNMDPSGQSLGGDITQGAVNPKLTFNPDVNSIVPFVAHQCGKDPTITTPAGGTDSRQFVMVPFEYGDSTPAAFMDSMILEGYDGQECGLVEGARLQDLGVKLDQGKNVVAELGFVACSDTYESDATQLAIGTYTGKPILLGHRSASIAGQTLKCKITVVAGGGYDGTIKFTVASYAGSTTIPFNFDKRQRVVLDTGVSGGVSRDQDLWFCIPSTSPASAVAVNDEWSFIDSRTPATASFSTRSRLKSGGIEITVGGTEYFFHSGEVKITRPRKANFVMGRMHAISVQKAGKWAVSLSLDRDRDDTDFVKRLRRAQTFSAVVKMYGLPIEGSILELWQIAINGKVSNVQRGVANENTLQEKIEIMAERSGSTDIVTHTVVCSLTSL